ncbi:hypothetical protein DFQ29_003409, partial [Apophysomyces sp. BC1021]
MLAQEKSFRSKLDSELERIFALTSTSRTPQLQWDNTKTEITHFIKQYSRKRATWRQAQLKTLQSKRNQLLRNRPPAAVLAQLLPRVESQISMLQAELVETAALRAGQRWREKGERSAGYLKRTIASRATACAMPVLQHPETNRLCDSTTDCLEAVRTYYQTLYSPEPIDDIALQDMLRSIPSNVKLSQDDCVALESEFTMEDLLSGVK